MKKSMSGWLVAIVALAALSNDRRLNSQEKGAEAEKPVPVVTDEQPMSFWMEKKLEYSKKILEALTSGRYEDIESSAEQMRLLGKIEGFVRRRSPSYTSHLQSFDLASRELTRQSRSKNIEGATLAFHQLTSSCVACHQSLREVTLTPEAKPTTPK